MKALVLAGGKGSRLRPFTYSGAKQLVPIANTPVLHFPIRQLVEAGLTEIGIVVGDTEAQIREAMGDGARFGARFTYIRQSAPAGIAHAVAIAEPFLGADAFVLYLGDNVLMGGIAGFVEEFERNGPAAAIVLKEVPDPRAFGVAVVADGRLVQMVEKPPEPPSSLAVIGVYAFKPAVFSIIAGQTPSGRGELEIADTINGLVAQGHDVRVSVTPEHWIDTGKMEDMLAANRVVLDRLAGGIAPDAVVENCRCAGAIAIGAGARLERCSLEGPVVIGAGAHLRDCHVGPYVAIGAGAEVERVALSNSIVMDEGRLIDCPGVVDSMIGRHACVRRAPAGARLTLGDHSAVDVA
ncbi:MAG: glucose-1-phosphate thymidylyltransferase [Dehalococcoidia bacterium]|nr:glucose-1-phosphate thymidylyltransferase [Dehalococcoidia bacterium]